jgi:hypothetical protein
MTLRERIGDAIVLGLVSLLYSAAVLLLKRRRTA